MRGLNELRSDSNSSKSKGGEQQRGSLSRLARPNMLDRGSTPGARAAGLPYGPNNLEIDAPRVFPPRWNFPKPSDRFRCGRNGGLDYPIALRNAPPAAK